MLYSHQSHMRIKTNAQYGHAARVGDDGGGGGVSIRPPLGSIKEPRLDGFVSNRAAIRGPEVRRDKKKRATTSSAPTHYNVTHNTLKRKLVEFLVRRYTTREQSTVFGCLLYSGYQVPSCVGSHRGAAATGPARPGRRTSSPISSTNFATLSAWGLGRP
ncbi:hypothetical protein PV325_006599 [Microctonus aethiopoides]|nr:hypothetical protein PV325_006599 [Microctonus aethiopoides]KAK0098112.1 hypothetical protein PV326_011098 [Microctonus aethiopoides]